jgi:hypothetical protein
MARTSQKARRSTGGKAVVLVSLQHRRTAAHLPSDGVARRSPRFANVESHSESSLPSPVVPVPNGRGMTRVVVPTTCPEPTPAPVASGQATVANPGQIQDKMDEEEVSKILSLVQQPIY